MIMEAVSALLWNAFNTTNGYLVAADMNWSLGIISVVLIILAIVVMIDGYSAINAYVKGKRSFALRAE